FDLGGSGPNLIGNIVGFGQKSGIYWALNSDNGSIVWSTPVGPGGGNTLGGIEWGTATDGQRIYVAIANSKHLPYTLVPSGQQITWGAWSALDVATGQILWQTADPTAGATDESSVSVANGVMYAGSYAGQMYALDTITGNILWSFQSGGSVLDGPSIVDGTVYWGSGYRRIRPGIGNNKVFAFSLSGSEHGNGHSKDDGKQH
ncbi:MAG TPA: PQQ-binding-like beta-propeller repeat protein, partial [Steroidobacteraceae bacterium]|nr:PQQ-binding-like beta-propeller repeat protein [Steroidobacteraceae bacterium]